MQIRFALLPALLAGCIDNSLVPCGDRLCPPDSVCDVDRCLSAAQLGACTGLVDGDPCSVLLGDGVCVDGACEVARCGDGLVDAAEVCDDGNRADGDGCRGDCLSTEVCGNGLVDPGERCDCGSDEATRPDGCTTSNDESVTALCDPACSRYCGDEIVTGAETCDGGNVPLACLDFGFYYGAVTCSPFCTFDRTACTGRCGDAMVQADRGEQCDGAVPPNTTCHTYGADFGHVTCSQFCTTQVAQDCHRFGWETVFPGVGNGGYIQAAALNRRGFMARNFDLVEVTYDGAVVERNLTGAGRILATDDEFVVLTSTIAARFDASGWTDFTPPAYTSIIADGDYLYTLSGCTVERIEVATWSASSLPAAPGLTTCAGLDVIDGAVLVGGTDRVAAYEGSWRVRTGLSQVSNVGWRDAGHAYVFAAGTLSIVEVDTAATPIAIGATGATLVTNAQGDVIDVQSGGSSSVTQGLLRLALPGTALGYARTPDGAFIRFERAIQRLRPLYLVIDTNAFLLSFQPQPDGAIASCNESVIRSAGAGATVTRGYDSIAMGGCTAMLGPITGEHFIGTASPERIYRFDTGTSGYVLEATLASQIWSLIADASGTPWVLTFTDILQRSGTTWTTTSPPAGCAWKDLVATSTDVYALGRCSNQSVLHRWTGSAWSVVATTAMTLSDLTVATEDDTVFAAGTQLVRFDGAAWVTLDATDAWLHVAARSATDAFVVSTSGFGLSHWNGMTTAPITTAGRLFTEINAPIRMGPRGLFTTGLGGLQLLPHWEPIDGI